MLSFHHANLLALFTIIVVTLRPENQSLLKEAKLELKKSKRKDYYKLLKVTKNATEDEIKKAYKKHALLHHPGKPRRRFLCS